MAQNILSHWILSLARIFHMVYTLDARKLPPDLKQDLLRQAMDDRTHTGVSWKEVGNKSPVSKTTMFRWSTMNMTPEAQAARQVHPRRPCLLTAEEASEVVRRATHARAEHVAVTQKWSSDAIRTVTYGRVDKPSPAYTDVSFMVEMEGVIFISLVNDRLEF